MSDIDFYINLIATGKIRGCTFGDPPEAWESALGDDYLDDRRKNRLRRDYGLLEISFQRVDGVWQCVGISCQIHRLKNSGNEAIPNPLVEQYGEFSDTLSVGCLSRVAQKGVQFQEAGEFKPGELARLVARGGHQMQSEVVVVANSAGLQKSEVWSIGVTRNL